MHAMIGRIASAAILAAGLFAAPASAQQFTMKMSLPTINDVIHEYFKAIKAGVKIACGTDAPAVPHGQNAKELWAMVDRGMTPMQALRAATVTSAELIERSLASNGGRRAITARELGLTRERVRQIQQEALQRLRRSLGARGVGRDAVL